MWSGADAAVWCDRPYQTLPKDHDDKVEDVLNAAQRLQRICKVHGVDVVALIDMDVNPFTVEIPRTQLHSLRGIIFRLQQRTAYARSN